MRTILAFIVLITATLTSVFADAPIANPVADFAARRGLNANNQISKIAVDITGDGLVDVLLCYVDPNPDIEDRRVIGTGDKRLWWTPYIKKTDGTYSLPVGIKENGEIITVPTIAFDPLETYIGQVSEIGRFALIAREKQTPRREEALSILWAFTWEGTYFKQQKQGEFVTGEQNMLFDKYLAEGKRTVLQVQQVTP